MKGKRLLSLLLCLVMVLGLLPTSVFADSESSLGENDVYKLQILTYSEKNGKVVPTTQLMDRARSSVTLKRWDTDTNGIKEETLPLTGYNGTATGKVMKDPNYTVSMTIYPAEGYKFADTNSVRLYIGAGATFNATDCCNYETKVNDDGSRTYTFKYTEKIGEAVATINNGALFFLFSFVPLDETDVYKLQILTYSEKNGKVAPTTQLMDRARSSVTLKRWDTDTNGIKEETLPLTGYNGTATGKVMKDPNYTVSMTIYPAEGYKFADTNSVRLYIGAGATFNATDCCNYETKVNSDGSRTYTFKYTEEIGEAVATVNNGALFFLFSFEEDKETPLGADDVYKLQIQSYSEVNGSVRPTPGNMDKDRSSVTLKYWNTEKNDIDEKTVFLKDYSSTYTGKVMKDPNYTVSMTIYPKEGYKFADTDSVRLYIGAALTFEATDCCNYETKVNSDGSRTYTFKYTEEIGEAVATINNGALFFLFSFEEGESTQLGAKDVYKLQIQSYSEVNGSVRPTPGNMDKDRSSVTLKYWNTEKNDIDEKTVFLKDYSSTYTGKVMKDPNYTVSMTIYPKEGYKFADTDSVRLYIGAALTFEATDCCNYETKVNSDGSRTYTFKYTEEIEKAVATINNGALFFLFSFEEAPQYVVEYYPITGHYDKPVKLNVTAGTRAPLLTQEQLDKVDKVYFEKVKIPAWRSEMPRTTTTDYIYTGESYTDAESMPVINGYTKLYAENTIEPGTLIPAEYRFLNLQKPVQAKWMFNFETWRYNFKENHAEAVGTDQKKVTFEIPVGTPIGEDRMLQFTKYSALKATNDALTVPKHDAVISKWTYQEDTDTYLPFTRDTVIPVYRALRSLLQGNSILYLTANVTYSCELTFNTNRDDLTIDPYRYEVTTTSNASTPAAKLTAEKINEINDKIATVTDKVFEGWYLKANFAQDSKVDIAGSKFLLYSDVDLYAKWVDPNTITYDLTYKGEDVTVENADAYKPYIVGAGAYLTEPARPVATGSQAGKLAFMGWYKDKAHQIPWNFKQNAVNAPTTLYAKWVKATPLTIQFKKYDPDDLGKLEDVRSVTVPVAAGYTFGTLPDLPNSTEGEYVVGKDRDIKYTGWRFRSGDAEPPLTSDMDLSEYGLDATKTLEVYTVYDTRFTFTFDTGEGGPTPKAQEVTAVDGKAVGKAKVPTEDISRAGYDFGGWYADSAGNTEFVFTEEYDKNTTIYAKWNAQTACKVTFDLSNVPGATVELRERKTDGTTSLVSHSNKTDTTVIYNLKRGSYFYTCSAPNYMSRTEPLTIDVNTDPELEIQISLTPFISVSKVSLSASQVMKSQNYNLDKLTVIEPANATRKSVTSWELKESYDGVTLNANVLSIDANCALEQIVLTATVTNGKLSQDGTSQEDFVQENIKLSIIPYVPTISFRNGKTAPSVLTKQLPEDRQTNSGGKLTLTKTDEPEATGYDFAGWYLDEDCTEAQKWDAAHIFETDSILYAKWVKKTIEITVTFSDGGSQTKTEKHNAGESLVLPANMFTKKDHIFVAWELPDKTTQTATSSIAALPESDVTYTATWKEINSSITKEDITQSLLGITDKNAADHKQQLIAARDALMAGSATKTDATLIRDLSDLFEDAGLGPVEIAGDAKDGVSEVGAILSSDGAKVILNVNKQATPGKTLPETYQNAEYTATWYSLSMTVGGTTTDPKVPVILTMPIPAALSKMAADTIRVLLYKGAATEPVVMTPTVNGSNLTFAYDGNGQLAFVGKSISDAADTRVTALEMRYNGTKMGNVEQDASGNFTVTLPSTTSESVLQSLSDGINSKWMTYMTVAPQAKVATAESTTGFDAEYWAKTGVALTYSLTSANKYSATRSFTVTAGDGTTTRTFTVTVRKITDADRTYKIAVANISGGTVTATPNPAAAGEEVTLTIEPNDGKKLVAGSLSYCLQSAGAKSVPIDENTRTFIMPAGDININAQFEDDASAPIKNPPQITAFMINGVSAVINQDTKVITIILPYGTDLKHVAPTIVTANASKVEPSSAQRVDLSTPKAYRVYASNGAYVTYTVTAYTEEPSPTQSLWEKLQNQINNTPNWWELAEYQKKTGYYR